MQVLNTTGKFQGPKDFRASRPMQIKPEIVGSRLDASGQVETYISRDGREWDPVIYDRLYNPPKGKLKGKFHKGANPDRRRVY